MKKLSTEINEQLQAMLETLERYRAVLPKRTRAAIVAKYHLAFIIASNWEMTIRRDVNGDLDIEEKK